MEDGQEHRAQFDREANGLWWADRHWVAHAKTELDDFMHTVLDEQWRGSLTGRTDVNAEVHMFINAYAISSGMMSSIVGQGAKYGAQRIRTAAANICAASTHLPH